MRAADTSLAQVVDATIKEWLTRPDVQQKVRDLHLD
jgi:hypothetical protein